MRTAETWRPPPLPDLIIEPIVIAALAEDLGRAQPGDIGQKIGVERRLTGQDIVSVSVVDGSRIAQGKRECLSRRRDKRDDAARLFVGDRDPITGKQAHGVVLRQA